MNSLDCVRHHAAKHLVPQADSSDCVYLGCDDLVSRDAGKSNCTYVSRSRLRIPFFIHIFTTTFAVLSGGNLSSKGRKPNTHLLSPFVANGLYIFLLPIILALLSQSRSLSSRINEEMLTSLRSRIWRLGWDELA